MNYLKFDSISSIEIIILILISLSIIFILLEPRLSKKNLVNKNEHGSSKFADIDEIKKNFIKEKVIGSNTVGFPVWYEKKNNKFEYVYLDNKSPHFLLIGSTGSGKSVTVVLNECLMFATSKEKHSVVVTDPKGEIFKATSKVFNDNGYDVITIDFRNPTKSKRINIMQPIIDEWKKYCEYNKAMLFLYTYFLKINKINLFKIEDKIYLNKIKKKYNLDDYFIDTIDNNLNEIKKIMNNKKMYDIKIVEIDKDDIKGFLKNKNNEEIINMIHYYQNQSSTYQAETNRIVISLADLLFIDKDAKDQFWINSAKQMFIGIVGIFLEDYEQGLISEDKINISSVKKFQNSSLIKENLNYLHKNINARKYGSLSKDYLASILSAAENTFKSITAIFGEKMAIFDDLNVENLTSTNEFKFTDLGSKPTALFIIVPDEEKSYFQLVTIIVGILTKDLTKFANLPENKGKLPVKVEWLLDEFANCPPLSSIETLVSVARSRGMRFQFFIQSFSQLDQVYGKEIANIIQDNAALVYLKTNSVETAEKIVKKLGRETIFTNSMSKSTDPMKIGANKTTSLMGKDLLTATEIIGLKYKTIIFPTISNPIFRDTYLYTDVYPKYKNITELDRKTNVLKRMTSNYYTVEEMRKNYDNINELYIRETARMIQHDFQKNMDKSINRIKRNIEKKTIETNINIPSLLLKDLLFDYSKEVKITDNCYVIDIDGLIVDSIIDKIESREIDEFTFSFIFNFKKGKTKIIMWDNTREKKII